MAPRQPAAALRCAWLVLAAAAALHLCIFARLLWRDAAELNFALLPPEDQLEPLSRTVVLMHHKRLPELNRTLTRLAELANADQLRILVVQSLDASEAAAADASAALLRQLATQLPLNLTHHPIVRGREAADGTYSVDAQRYGTKRNSFRNLLNGLDAAFLPWPELRSVVVLERVQP